MKRIYATKLAALIAFSCALTACAQPIPDSELLPVEKLMEEAATHVETVNLDSGTRGEVTIVTVSANTIYVSPEDFRAEDMTAYMGILNDNLASVPAHEKTLQLRFLTEDATLHRVFLRTLREPGVWDALSQQMTLYTPETHSQRGRVKCALIDGVHYELTYDEGFSVEDYVKNGNAVCQKNINDGTYITWEP